MEKSLSSSLEVWKAPQFPLMSVFQKYTRRQTCPLKEIKRTATIKCILQNKYLSTEPTVYNIKL